MIESPQLRWAFIRKVYALVAMQLLATAAAAAAVYFVPAIRRFFAARTPAAVAAFVAIILAPIILVLPMVFLRKRHPVNLVLLALFTVSMSFAVGLGCLSRKGIIIIEAASLTLVVVRNHDFSFLGPFLAAACLILMLYWLGQPDHL
ncbi:hypothetical protein PAHAL_2G044800 [Panicum hallii]|uniref:Uncharacterized protein n=1 Tax=Panicum hallii TaxID=206008 RepID=A0A2T8KMV0_9POAL|nr:hypothetical protein PAHAL_2G044800 [Panicum hallii]